MSFANRIDKSDRVAQYLTGAGRMALRESAAFQRLRRSLNASAEVMALETPFEPAAPRSTL